MKTPLQFDIQVWPQPMYDKQLMEIYNIKHRRTWKKLLIPIASELRQRRANRRYLYNIKEINKIFDLLGIPDRPKIIK